MRPPIDRLLHWTPRILGLCFAAFISVFALDVFGEGLSFWRTTLALAMHLIPTAIILGALGISWRWPWAGGAIFLALGAWYVISSWGRFHWSAYLLIAGPAFLLGLLFELDWWLAKLRKSSDTPLHP